MSDFQQNFTRYEHPQFGFVRLPNVEVTDKEKQSVGLEPSCSNADFLACLAKEGLASKNLTGNAEYVERTARELATAEKLGFVDYFLLIWRLCSRADKKSIARDYGRGSCAGSLVFFLIDVTAVDPIRYGLFFERFISETRAKKKVINGITYIDGSLAPDVDIDIEQARRGEVVDDLVGLYPERVCKISTVSTLSGKILIKECGKIIAGFSEEAMKDIADMIPKEFGIIWDIEEAYGGQKAPDSEEWLKEPVTPFRKWCDSNPLVYSTALKLRDLVKNRGTHPSGFVVAYDKLSDFLPVEYSPHEEGTSSGSLDIAACFAMDDISNLTIKVDILGVRCCSVVADVLLNTGEKMADINVDSDPLIYDNLQNLKTAHGIFQVEAPTNLKVAQIVKPRNLSELSDVLAIARPGALSFLGKYAENQAEKIHPLFDPILTTTRGVCLYQEQMMKLAHAVGFTLEEAEVLRRVVGKKKVKEVAEWQVKIHETVAKNGLPEELGTLLWKILEDSSKYSFNASHSTSYASLSALTIYLKFKYPLQFFLALLKQAKNEPNPIEEIQKIEVELKWFGIKLLPPDLIKSSMDFHAEGEDIRFGLSSIKGISDKTLEKLLTFKAPHVNRFELFESAAESGLSVGVLCALIQCGCLDEMAGDARRPSIALQAQLWNILTVREKKVAMKLGEKHQYNLFGAFTEMKGSKDLEGKPVIKDSRMQTILKKYEPKKAIWKQNSPHCALTNVFYERKLLGYSYSAKLRDIFADQHPHIMSLKEVASACEDDRVSFVAFLQANPSERTSAKKNKYAKFIFSDEGAMMEGMIFNTQKVNKLDEVKSLHGGELPEKDAIVYCSGRKKSGTVFLDTIRDKKITIYTKFGELEKTTKETD